MTKPACLSSRTMSVYRPLELLTASLKTLNFFLLLPSSESEEVCSGRWRDELVLDLDLLLDLPPECERLLEE